MKKISKKALISTTLAAVVTLGATACGCVTVNEADVKRVVSTVNISGTSDFNDEFGSEYAAAVTDEVILKRDLISSFLTTGYSYVQSGYSYSDVFDMLSDSLVENAAVTQYAIVYVLRDKIDKGEVTLSEYTAEDKTEQERYIYLLGGEDSIGVKTAKYTVNAALNSTLDSYEESFIEEEDDDSYTGTDTRTTPTNVDTLKDDYIPEEYNVYTGIGEYLLKNAGDEYEPLDGTNRNTRRKAYNSFVSYLKSNYLLTSDDTDTQDVWKLSYVQEMYTTQLQQQIITEFSDLFEDEKEAVIDKTDNDVYTYIANRYEKLLKDQTENYEDTDTFESALDSISDTSYILYSPSTDGEDGQYGFVYNILLPFSTAQSAELTGFQYYRDNKDSYTYNDYYYDRNRLLENITTTDQRSAWFNGETDYSFDASESGLDYYGKSDGRDYLFFENNLTMTDKYEALDKYVGLYSYNGTVKENSDGSCTLIPNKLTIDGMIEEFSGYIDYVLGTNGNVEWNKNESYYTTSDFMKDGSKDDIDYSKFVYGTGKVNIGDSSSERYTADMFSKDSARYKVLSAVNELQYAYTTDTGVLSNYIGYSVTADTTSYVKEFEYAAWEAIGRGAGSFSVCATDYGWHLIYVTETYTVSGGNHYEKVSFTKTSVEAEGTFENLFYTWVKDSDLSNEATLKRSEIVRNYVNDDTVTTDSDVYADLAALDNE